MIVPFDPAAHLADVNAWHAAHGEPPLSPEMLPATGFVVEGVAAGWLYLTDSSVGLLDSFSANPLAGMRARARAIDEIGAALIQQARLCGCLGLVALSRFHGLGRMAVRRGFVYRGPMHFLTLEV